MRRLPPRSTRTYTLFPDTTLFRSRQPLARPIERRIEIERAAQFDLDGVDPRARRGVAFEDVAARIGAVERVAQPGGFGLAFEPRSEEHTSELQSLMRISYAVFCLKKKK